jgi:hypothetical protein
MRLLRGAIPVFAVAGAAALVSARAGAALSSGALITNFASATFSLPSGSAGDTIPTMSPGFRSQTAAVLVTDLPQLCMGVWKRAIQFGTWAPITGAYPGNIVCFEIGFSNCGVNSGFSVVFYDSMPGNVVRAPSFPGSSWVSGGGGFITASWATSMAGPWNTLSGAGQTAPHYLRWVMSQLGMGKSGFLRYCVTIL